MGESLEGGSVRVMCWLYESALQLTTEPIRCHPCFSGFIKGPLSTLIIMSMRQRGTGMAQDMVGAHMSAICGSRSRAVRNQQ